MTYSVTAFRPIAAPALAYDYGIRRAADILRSNPNYRVILGEFKLRRDADIFAERMRAFAAHFEGRTGRNPNAEVFVDQGRFPQTRKQSMKASTVKDLREALSADPAQYAGPLLPHGFAEACYDMNSIEDLEQALTETADTTDCDEWDISPEEWRNQIEMALVALRHDRKMDA